MAGRSNADWPSAAEVGLQEAAGMAFTLRDPEGRMHQEWGGGARRRTPLVKELPIVCIDTTFPAFFMLPLRISQ